MSRYPYSDIMVVMLGAYCIFKYMKQLLLIFLATAHIGTTVQYQKIQKKASLVNVFLENLHYSKKNFSILIENYSW